LAALVASTVFAKVADSGETGFFFCTFCLSLTSFGTDMDVVLILVLRILLCGELKVWCNKG
jgi:hypothetical protein